MVGKTIPLYVQCIRIVSCTISLLKQDDVCTIKPVPFRGVACSDAAGSQVNYDNIEENLLPYSLTGLLWDDDAKSPYFSYKVCSVYIIFYVGFFIVNCIKGWFAEKNA